MQDPCFFDDSSSVAVADSSGKRASVTVVTRQAPSVATPIATAATPAKLKVDKPVKSPAAELPPRTEMFTKALLSSMESMKPNVGLESEKLQLERDRLSFEQERWREECEDKRAAREQARKDSEMRDKLLFTLLDKLSK